MPTHYHVAPYTGTRKNPNGACRCQQHGTGLRGQPLPTNRPSPSCEMGCYMCERIAKLPGELAARFGRE